MAYKREFIERVKRAYPTFEKMHGLAESGSESLGNYLCDGALVGIDYREILAAASLEELKEKALLVKEKNDLYRDFVDGVCFDTRGVDGLISRANVLSKQHQGAEQSYSKNLTEHEMC